MQTITKNDTPFACDMSAIGPEEKVRVLELLEVLKTNRRDVKEMPDGYSFHYDADNEIIKNIAEFIIYERLCCPFFEFELNVKKENGGAWFRLRGPEGIKDFIKLEFAF